MGLLVVFIGLVVLLGIGIWVVGKQLPSKWEIEKAVLVRATPEQIYPLLEDLHQWELWSNWCSEQEDMELEYKGAAQGMGAAMIWTTSRLQGQFTLTRCQSPNEIQYHLDINRGKFTLTGTLFLSVTDAEFTQVAWRCALVPPKHFQFILRYQIHFLRSFFETAIEESLVGMQTIFQPEEEQGE